MEEKNKTTSKSSEEKYSLDKLWKDISVQYEEEEKSDTADVMRDKCLKLKIISHLITLAGKVCGCEDEDMHDVIKLTEEEHDALFSYSFSLSINPQFDYSWSYLRKQWDGYLEMLGKVCSFLIHFVSYVSTLQKSKRQYADLTFVFANVFVVSFDKKTQKSKVEIIWNCLDELFHIGKFYSIAAKENSTLLLSAFMNKDSDNLESFLEKVSKLYKTVK